MPYAEVPAFVTRLRERGTVSARALELLILTGLRSNEVLGLRWSEADLAGALLTIGAERMKAGRVHRVPLTRRALELLEAQRGTDGDLVFGRLSTNALRVIPLDGFTVHGFRSSLRQYLADRTDTPNHIAEGILADTVQGVEGAYRRDASIDKAGMALKAWADFLAAGI